MVQTSLWSCPPFLGCPIAAVSSFTSVPHSFQICSVRTSVTSDATCVWLFTNATTGSFFTLTSLKRLRPPIALDRYF